MKNLTAVLLSLAFIAASVTAPVSCSALAPDNGMIRVEGPLQRQIDRVLQRHDGYVQLDPKLDLLVIEQLLSESAAVRAIEALGTVSRASLGEALAPVEDRHDAYVRDDARLDELSRATYLASTQQLRHLLALPAGVPK